MISKEEEREWHEYIVPNGPDRRTHKGADSMNEQERQLLSDVWDLAMAAKGAAEEAPSFMRWMESEADRLGPLVGQALGTNPVQE